VTEPPFLGDADATFYRVSGLLWSGEPTRCIVNVWMDIRRGRLRLVVHATCDVTPLVKYHYLFK
jgi:hypothetical protein